jgi:hypothetical protein
MSSVACCEGGKQSSYSEIHYRSYWPLWAALSELHRCHSAYKHFPWEQVVAAPALFLINEATRVISQESRLDTVCEMLALVGGMEISRVRVTFLRSPCPSVCSLSQP